MSNAAPITRDELAEHLAHLLPKLTADELAPVVSSLHLILKAGKLAVAAPKAKPRQYREKSVAETLHLKP